MRQSWHPGKPDHSNRGGQTTTVHLCYTYRCTHTIDGLRRRFPQRANRARCAFRHGLLTIAGRENFIVSRDGWRL